MTVKGREFLSQLKLYADYLKWIPEESRYETWEEACDDVINGHRLHYNMPELEPYLQEATSAYKEKLVLASMRNLQFRGPQIQKHNAKMYNCAVTYCDKPQVFYQVFYTLLCGTGMGVSLMREFVDQLPLLRPRSQDVVMFTVEDSVQGWAESLDILISSFLAPEDAPRPEFSGKIIKFDLSGIRPEGALISGGFKAPGPKGLQQSLELVEQLYISETSSGPVKWRSIVAYDTLMHASDAVLSGGVRRSAMNIILSPDDEEMLLAKVGNWRSTHPWRARSNNSVGLLKGKFTQQQLQELIALNQGMSDIGFVFMNNIFEMFNPCFEIGFTPVLFDRAYTNAELNTPSIIQHVLKLPTGVQFCNLTEQNGAKIKNKQDLFRSVRAATILGTLQAGYTDFPYLGDITEELVRGEALLGVSITGWMNSPWLYQNPEVLTEAALLCKEVNEEVAALIGINPAARTTTSKPSGNSSTVLMCAPGVKTEHSKRYFRLMQLNKEAEAAKFLVEHAPEVLEESSWSNTNSDYIVYAPIENEGDLVYDLGGIEHLEIIRTIQQNWVLPGTREEACYVSTTRHNVSCTVVLDDVEAISTYLHDNQEDFTAVSFISKFGDKDYAQAPYTSVLNTEELVERYGDGIMFASGLVVDGLHYFNNNLWKACDHVLDRSLDFDGTRTDVLLKKEWVRRAKKFAKNYFKGDLQKCVYALKDIHLWHKWNVVNRTFKVPNFVEILKEPRYVDISNYAALACHGPSCEINTMGS